MDDERGVVVGRTRVFPLLSRLDYSIYLGTYICGISVSENHADAEFVVARSGPALICTWPPCST